MTLGYTASERGQPLLPCVGACQRAQLLRPKNWSIVRFLVPWVLGSAVEAAGAVEPVEAVLHAHQPRSAAAEVWLHITLCLTT